MKLIPNYSYEYNWILNPQFNEKEHITNYTSLITDKDRFLTLIPLITKNKELIEKTLGYKLKKEIEFYIVRAEKFKSFSQPITIEYSILPEEMLIFLLKEIIKTTITDRFPDETTREQHINSFITYIIINGDFEKLNLIKFGKNLHDYSQTLNPTYEYKEIDFSKTTMKQYIEKMYNN